MKVISVLLPEAKYRPQSKPQADQIGKGPALSVEELKSAALEDPRHRAAKRLL